LFGFHVNDFTDVVRQIKFAGWVNQKFHFHGRWATQSSSPTAFGTLMPPNGQFITQRCLCRRRMRLVATN
jgi:hypothetical protein